MATISNSSVSTFVWEMTKESLLSPGGIVFCSLAGVGGYFWYQHLLIESRANKIFKDLQVAPKNIAILHQAIRVESSPVLYSLLKKVEAGSLNIFESEIAEKKTTSLMVACQDGKWEGLEMLLILASRKTMFDCSTANGKERYYKWLNQQDSFGATAMHRIMYYVLSRQGSLDRMEMEKIKKALNDLHRTDSTLKDSYGFTYLDHAQKLHITFRGDTRNVYKPLSRSTGDLARK